MPTILNQLIADLKEQLIYYHKGVKNVSRPGADTHRVKDKISFQVYAKNKSSNIPLKNLSGWIRHAPATAFTPIYFSLPSLAPQQEAKIGPEVQAEIVADTNDLLWMDRIATVDTSAEADLSKVKFVDTGVLVDRILPE